MTDAEINAIVESAIAKVLGKAATQRPETECPTIATVSADTGAAPSPDAGTAIDAELASSYVPAHVPGLRPTRAENGAEAAASPAALRPSERLPATLTGASDTTRPGCHGKPDRSLARLKASIVTGLEGAGGRLGWRDLSRRLNGYRHPAAYQQAVEGLLTSGVIAVDPKSPIVTLLRVPAELFPEPPEPRRIKRPSRGRNRSQSDLEQRKSWLARKRGESGDD